MSYQSERKQSKNLKLLKKLPFKEDFSAETDKQQYILSLVCTVCCDSLAHIRNEARLRGIKRDS